MVEPVRFAHGGDGDVCVCVDVLALFEHSDVVECYHQKKRINTSAGAYLFGFWDLMHMYHG